MRNVDNYVVRWRYIILTAVVVTLSMMFSLTTLAAAPVLDRASTNGDGTAIILTFDKGMASPEGEHGQFSATVTDAVYFNGAALDSDNNTRIILTIDGSPVSNTDDSITISYTQGSVEDSDGELLTGFTDESVVNAVFDSGNGDPGDPYVITNENQLDAVRYHRDKDFELGADINLGVSTYNTGEGWEPIGTLAHPFTGTFDGGGYIISGLLINRPVTDYVGLFGCVGFGAVIQDLELQGVDVTGNEFAGGLAGLSEGNITNCNVTGDTGILIGNNVVGGLIGRNAYGTISNSNAQVQVSGNKKVGGLAGDNINGGVVTESYAVSGVQGTESVGGLIGENDGTISSSYATGDISGVVNIGGLVGLNRGTISGSSAAGAVESVNYNYVGGLVGQNGSSTSAATIENCYATGVVTGNLDYVGGLVGNFIHGSVRNCYALNAEIIRNSGSTYIKYGRIIGASDSGYPTFLSKNWANSAMIEPWDGAYNEKTHSGKDGADLYDWNLDGGVLTYTLPLTDNTTVSAATNPESPEVNQEFTFTVQVRDGNNNPIDGLQENDFAITQNGSGTLTVDSIVEDGATGNYTVTASHDTAETITITVDVLGVVVGNIADLVIEETTPSDGEAYSFGTNSQGQLGLGYNGDNVGAPTLINGLSGVKAISAGGEHTLVLLENGDVYSFGKEDLGRLGPRPGAFNHTPAKIEGIPGPAKAVAAGYQHSLVLLENGDVYSFGYGGNGQLGHGDTGNTTIPTKIDALTEVKIKAISATWVHSLVLSEAGEVYSFGAGGNGRLGLGDEDNRNTPTKIEALAGVEVKAIAAGGTHSLVLSENGEVYSFGNGSDGRLGLGAADTNNKLTPVLVSGISQVKAITAGVNHSLLLLENGDVYSFGYGLYGQLGQGDNSNKYTPTKITGLINVQAVVGGASHSLVLLESGEVYSFGRNNKGQLGHGDSDDRSTPVKIEDFTDATAIAAGVEHSLIGISSGDLVPNTDAEDVAADKAALTFDTIKGENDTEHEITKDLILIYSGQNGTAITWSVSPAGWINTASGAVTRPSYSQGDKIITLTATISKGNESDSKIFTLTVKAQETTDSGGSSGGSKRRTAPAPEPEFNATIEAGDYQQDLDVDVDDRKGIMEVNLDDDTLSRAFDETEADSDGVKKVSIVMPEIDDVTSYRLQIPEEFHSYGSGDNRIQMITGIGTVVLSDNMLGNMELETGTQAAFTIAQADVSDVDEETKNLIGDRPVIQMTLTLDGDQTNWSNPSAPVTVSIPYTPTEDELADPEHITVWYIDGSGNAVAVPNGRYDPVTGTVTFATTHFSRYAVVYVQKAFDDLSNVDWAKKPIQVLASKGIVRGITHSQYYPSINITRADFLYSLVRALGVDADVEGNFDDISQDAYYYKEIGIAKKLGITSGIGNNKFNPDASITRQDMITLTVRSLDMLGMVKEQASATGLDIFADKSLIADYALQAITTAVKEGLIIGSGDCINPLGNTTRAEAAVFLYRIYNK